MRGEESGAGGENVRRDAVDANVPSSAFLGRGACEADYCVLSERGCMSASACPTISQFPFPRICTTILLPPYSEGAHGRTDKPCWSNKPRRSRTP